jgi:hypothetical protein
LASKRGLLGAALAVTALAVAGCGSDKGSDSTPSTNPEPTISVQTTPLPAQTSTTPPGTVEQQEGGGGDESGNVVPVDFKVNENFVDPPSVDVPAFFRMKITVESADKKPHTVAFSGKQVTVPAGGKADFTVDGLKKGVYPVTIDGRTGAAVINTGVAPGP